MCAEGGFTSYRFMRIGKFISLIYYFQSNKSFELQMQFPIKGNLQKLKNLFLISTKWF